MKVSCVGFSHLPIIQRETGEHANIMMGIRDSEVVFVLLCVESPYEL